jgi:hypothetical protein
MGSIEVEESIVALAIQESLSDKLLIQEPLRSRLPGIEVRNIENETFRDSFSLASEVATILLECPKSVEVAQL